MVNFKKFFKRKKVPEITRHGNQIEAGVLTRRKIEAIIRNRENRTIKDLEAGYKLIEKYPRSISFFGATHLKEDSEHYKNARAVAKKVVEDLGYAVVTGGGPGIMEAANRGAFEAKGASLGFAIRLPSESKINDYVTEHVLFEYFFSRKALLFFTAEAYIYFPGGWGTFSELFDVLTLIQTKKVEKIPVLLMGRKFWTPFLEIFRDKLLNEAGTISKEDLEICQIVDTPEQVVEIIKNTPPREF